MAIGGNLPSDSVALPFIAGRLTSVDQCITIMLFFGMLTILTRLEFGRRRSLWEPISDSKYISPAKFGRIMSRNRFEDLVRFLSFSGTVGLNGGDRWFDVTGFVEALNNHRQACMSPSEQLCVDESMSRWYGLGAIGLT